MNGISSESKKSGETNPILVAVAAVIPAAVAYVILYAFDAGYYAFYEVPNDFFAPNITREIWVFLWLAFALISFYQFAPDFISLRKLSHAEIVGMRNLLFTLGFAMIPAALACSPQFFAIIIMLTYLVISRKRARLSKTGGPPTFTAASVWHELLGDTLSVDLFSMVILGCAAYNIGYQLASSTMSFYVDGKWAIIRRDGDTLVEKTITVETNRTRPWIQVGSQIRLQPIGDKQALTFSPSLAAEAHLSGWTPKKQPWWMWFFKTH